MPTYRKNGWCLVVDVEKTFGESTNKHGSSASCRVCGATAVGCPGSRVLGRGGVGNGNTATTTTTSGRRTCIETC